MGELNIEKVDEDKFVSIADAPEYGYYGYTPDDASPRPGDKSETRQAETRQAEPTKPAMPKK